MLSHLTRLLGFKSSRHPAPRRNFRPLLDQLEDRSLMATFTVDDNFAADVPAQRKYNDIQSAVNAAVAGDTINVKAGVYRENVLVGKRLSIVGQSKPLVDPVDDGVLGAPVYGFNLQANDIAITGFRIGDNNGDTTSGGGDGSVGINTSSSFSGYKIRNNTISKNVFGIYLNTTIVGSRLTEVTGNTISDNNVGFGVLPAAGNGIYSDQGAKNVKITGNTFQLHGNEEIIFVGLADTQFSIVIQHNTLKNGSGIFFINVDGGSVVSHNNISNSAFNGIELAGNNRGILVQHNRLNNVGIQGYTGIYLHDGYAAGPNESNTVQFNHVTNAGLVGIRVRDSNLNVVKFNVVIGTKGDFLDEPAWGNGITIQNGQQNTVESNTVRTSARHGIYVDETSAGNRITSNNSFDNAKKVPGAFDYADFSPGPPPAGGTPGTSNTYKKNKGRTQNKPGLIS